MEQKRISIIIPCYNVERYIDRCFESLRNQTIGMENMELIFVNDASTDASLNHLLEYEKQYPENIIVIPFEENRGQGAARNVALSYASAPYIGFVDGDDMVDFAMYETMLEAIEQYNCDFVECNWDFFSDNTDFQDSAFNIPYTGYYNFADYKVKTDYIVDQLFFTSVCNKIYKKSFLVENDIFCLEGVRYEDIFFCYLAFLYANSYYHINRSFYHYYQNPKGTVQQRKQMYQFDRMDVSLAFLSTCQERGLMQEYKDIIEWMFLEKYYIYMIWDIWDIFPEQAYDYYLEMKKMILQLVPDYKTNPYRELESNRMDHVILKLIEYPLTKVEFEDLMKQLWNQQKRKPI
ncbi:MAG: glycosyltransferase family 2 protein [Lachnospiraceae bacterium]